MHIYKQMAHKEYENLFAVCDALKIDGPFRILISGKQMINNYYGAAKERWNLKRVRYKTEFAFLNKSAL
jgi:hypothetical protein